ncbi:hypothetical protein GCM10010399_44070 [Dactylosporangium fulvum]|uniref:4Fe-4S ferredoxin-type domain-containing protein n=1 Tax=Dactylosporangium fulvum TaxID=53359 RepID=A0ABY5W9D8_9ACTN|nr:hypothetical protein [Dactylosporangium fulvum]UWP85926.1 hypothetical protein Dfulv_17405 [Dactylosporangium fulvum]
MTGEQHTGQVHVTPLDPDSPAGRAAAESLSQALAEILVVVQRRERAAQVSPARCPECVCLPDVCRDDETGAHCEERSCGPCLHGCPLDDCPEHRAVR